MVPDRSLDSVILLRLVPLRGLWLGAPLAGFGGAGPAGAVAPFFMAFSTAVFFMAFFMVFSLMACTVPVFLGFFLCPLFMVGS